MSANVSPIAQCNAGGDKMKELKVKVNDSYCGVSLNHLDIILKHLERSFAQHANVIQ